MLNEIRDTSGPNPVPSVLPLEFGTTGQTLRAKENIGTNSGTIDLKSLASHILMRDKSGNNFPNVVPHGVKTVGQVWNKNDWQAFYDERAGIADNGRQPNDHAKSLAYESCISHWVNKNPPTHNDPNTCPQCHQSVGTNALPVLTGNGGHIWLHDRCHAHWLARRRQEAIAAMTAMGIIGVYHAR